ncbi:MAG TPA: choice-of-anchor Q domain-containing protein, partial [Candidatus Sumerlaeota bacterium]|nr:choice-of-anchor Q domain-containing protein [Candidatus Sumerlaeota bacterium]
GGTGPAIRFEDKYAEPVLDRVIVQREGKSGGAGTIVWGAATDSPEEFNDAAINGGAFQAATGQAGSLIAGYQPEVLFRDYGSGSLALCPNSPAVDFGTTENTAVLDAARRPRGYDNGLYDVGAFEYVPLGRNAVGASWRAYE